MCRQRLVGVRHIPVLEIRRKVPEPAICETSVPLRNSSRRELTMRFPDVTYPADQRLGVFWRRWHAGHETEPEFVLSDGSAVCSDKHKIVNVPLWSATSARLALLAPL